jgi:hypothetical protein
LKINKILELVIDILNEVYKLKANVTLPCLLKGGGVFWEIWP